MSRADSDLPDLLARRVDRDEGVRALMDVRADQDHHGDWLPCIRVGVERSGRSADKPQWGSCMLLSSHAGRSFPSGDGNTHAGQLNAERQSA